MLSINNNHSMNDRFTTGQISSINFSDDLRCIPMQPTRTKVGNNQASIRVENSESICYCNLQLSRSRMNVKMSNRFFIVCWPSTPRIRGSRHDCHRCLAERIYRERVKIHPTLMECMDDDSRTKVFCQKIAN